MFTFDEGPSFNDFRKPIQYITNNKGCWECVSHTKDKWGYVKLTRNGKKQYLHRYFYELHNGLIPKGKLIMHSCDNPACFNPEHLSIGTDLENSRDKVSKDRCHTAKLTVNDVLAIFYDSRSRKEIAAAYKVHPITIKRIKLKKTWISVLG